MLVLSFAIDGQGTLYYYIVDDVSSEDAWRRRNQNLTRFFDCFSITRGDFNYRSWIGRRGAIKIDKRAPNGNGEQKGFEVKALIVSQQGQSRPQYPQGQAPTSTNRPRGYNQTSPQNHYQQRPSAYQGTVPQDTQPAATDPKNFDNIPF